MCIRDSGQIMAEHPDAELYLVDTHLASVAEGLLVHEALRQRDKGLTARELAQWAEEARYFVDAEFMVEDLDALRRGGRIPGSVAYAGISYHRKRNRLFPIRRRPTEELFSRHAKAIRCV